MLRSFVVLNCFFLYLARLLASKSQWSLVLNDLLIWVSASARVLISRCLELWFALFIYLFHLFIIFNSRAILDDFIPVLLHGFVSVISSWSSFTHPPSVSSLVLSFFVFMSLLEPMFSIFPLDSLVSYLLSVSINVCISCFILSGVSFACCLSPSSCLHICLVKLLLTILILLILMLL